MKSLPEKDFWNAIRNRFENYKEDPQDDWLKIAGAIPAAEQGRRNKSVNLGADLLSVTSITVLVWTLHAFTQPAQTGAWANVATPPVAEEMSSRQANAVHEGERHQKTMQHPTTA